VVHLDRGAGDRYDADRDSRLRGCGTAGEALDSTFADRAIPRGRAIEESYRLVQKRCDALQQARVSCE
jgi:hypothetical protein